MIEMMKKMSPSPTHSRRIKELESCGENLIPLQAFRGFAPMDKRGRENLKTWYDWFAQRDLQETWKQMDMAGNNTKMMFSMMAPGSEIGDLTRSSKIALTDVLTDPMTVFYALKEAG